MQCRHHAIFSSDRSTVAELLQVNGFQFQMAAVGHLGFGLRVFRPPINSFLVFVTVQNLVGIDAVV